MALDFSKTYCLKSNPNIPFTINRKIDKLSPELIKLGVEVGDLMCQWQDKKNLTTITDYFKEHQIKEYKSSAGTFIIK
jgi:hypothetical protein